MEKPTAFDFFGDALSLHDRVRVFGRGVAGTITAIAGASITVSLEGEMLQLRDAQVVKKSRPAGDLDADEVDRHA